MASPLLYVTDGLTSAPFLGIDTGFLLDDWTPSIAPLKGGGTYQQSVLSDGRQLVMTNYDNAIETFSFKVHGGNQDAVIQHTQILFRLLEKARTYWYAPFQTEPVWLVARAPEETNTRYAIIHNYQQSGLDNPYAMPFFNCPDPALDGVTVAIERGHWANVVPGSGECVAITGSSLGVTAFRKSIAANADDGWATLSVGHTATAFTSAGNALKAGRDGAGIRYGCSLRFASVDIPDGAIITGAYINLVAKINKAQPVGNLIVYGDDADNASAPTNAATWNAKNLTSASFVWIPYDPYTYSAGDIHQTLNTFTGDLTAIVNEIRDRGGWSSGNAMQFFIEENGSGAYYLEWASLENVTYDEAELVIEYTYGDTGQDEATCDPQVWAVDKWALANISHVYAWFGAAWTGNLATTADAEVTADPPVAANKVYFGIETSGDNAGPFNNLVLSLLASTIGISGVWEYYQGAPTSAWTQFASTDIIDKTSGLTTAGRNSVTFVPPKDFTNGDWVAGDLNSIAGDGAPPAVTAWWIRFRLTAVSGSPDPITINANDEPYVYSVTWPFVSWGDTEVKGDIPAVARISLDDSGQLDSSPTVQHRAIVALSSLRGPYGGNTTYDFSAYLPLGDEQLPSVMGTGSYAFPFGYEDDVSAPSGRAMRLSPVATTEYSFNVTINSLHYFGSYKVFIRVRQLGGSDNHFKVKVASSHNDVVYATTDEVGVTVQSTDTAPNWQLLDLGMLDIPTGLPARTADEGVDIDLVIITTVSDLTGDLFYMDLILMPTDEWIVELTDLGDNGFSEGRILHIDSLSVPKVDLRGLTKYSASPAHAEPLPWKTLGSQMLLPANVEARLWILMARQSGTDWISDGITTARIQLYSAEQYLGLRGGN